MCDGTPCPCNITEPVIGVDGVRWAPWWWWMPGALSRCPAVLPPTRLVWHPPSGVVEVGGQCGLVEHEHGIDHALPLRPSMPQVYLVRFRTEVARAISVLGTVQGMT